MNTAINDVTISQHTRYVNSRCLIPWSDSGLTSVGSVIEIAKRDRFLARFSLVLSHIKSKRGQRNVESTTNILELTTIVPNLHILQQGKWILHETDVV